MENPLFSDENSDWSERSKLETEGEESRAAGSDPPAPSPAESKTREYLSNERTYLSWMRTAISLMGIGVILGRIHVVQLTLAPTPSTIWQLGIIFAVVGLMTIFLATQHYLAIQRAIANDSDAATERWVIVFSFAATLISSGILYYAMTYVLNSVD